MPKFPKVRARGGVNWQQVDWSSRFFSVLRLGRHIFQSFIHLANVIVNPHDKIFTLVCVGILFMRTFAGVL